MLRFEAPPTRLSIQEKIDAFEHADDVFSRDFLDVVLVDVTSTEGCGAAGEPLALFAEFGTKDIYCLEGVEEKTIPEGPFFIQSNILFQTWRLYADTYDAFVFPTIQLNGEPDK